MDVYRERIERLVAFSGPLPKKWAVRRHRNTRQGNPTDFQTVEIAGQVEMPEALDHWTDQARDWYLSLANSKQSQHFEPSDWAFARIIAEFLSKPRLSASMVIALQRGMGRLGDTESARRRMEM